MGFAAAILQLFLAFQSNFYERGLKAMEEKRYQTAVDDFTNAIAAEPKDFALHFNLALAYSLLNKDAEGIAEYKKALDLKPDLYQAQLNLAILLLRQKQPADAVPFAASAAAQKPKEFRPNYYLGEALLASGDPAKAESAYRAALEADPKSAAAESGLARALSEQNKLADSEPHFRKAAELDASYKDSLLELASLFEANEPDKAIDLYRQFPDNAGAQERMGALLLKQGKAEDAVARLQEAVKQDPTVANRSALATAYMRNKQPDKALPLIRELLAAQPNDFELIMVYGVILRDQRNFSDAAKQFYRATQMKPADPQPWTELGDMLVMLENYPGALAALDKVAALHAEKPGHVFVRAIVLDKIKQTKPALEAYQRFLSMSNGQFPNEEFKARQRSRILQRELSKR